VGWFSGWRREPIRVVCTGNSVTAGVVAGGGTPYVAALHNLLGWKYRILNRGCGGTSVLDWTNPPIPWGKTHLPPPLGGAYEKLVAEYLPADYVVVELGGNDAVGFFEKRPVPVETYQGAMLKLASRLKRDGAKRVIILTPMPNPGANHSARGRLLGYRLSLLGIPWPRGVEVIDIYRQLDPLDDFVGGNCHPTEQGHRKIAEAVARRIRGRRKWGWWR
jgi:lysophospholipase L1-like esterase